VAVLNIGYSESDLISNRASLLLYGGTQTDRRAWAEEAQQCFEAEGPLVQVIQTAQLGLALSAPRGVVFLPDVLALGAEAQALVMRCLQHQEERPKIILGLSRSPDDAVTAGELRDDLAFRLRTARVNLGEEATQQAIRVRRSKRPPPPKPAAKPVAKSAARHFRAKERKERR
jgi:hypothetical protein